MGLDEAELVAVVREQYGESSDRLEFEPVGEDSWCYRLGELWVSLRRDLRGHFPAAYEAASLLWQEGNESVMAPLAGADGEVVRTVCGHPVVVFPHVAAAPVAVPLAPGELDDVVGVLSCLHGSVTTAPLSRERYELSFEDDLDWSINHAIEQGSETGPYSARLRALIRANQRTIVSLRAELKDLAATCAASDSPFVLTHGEPHPGNILRHGDRLLLADWGELMWGPAERDWYHVISSLGGSPRCRPDFLRFYEIRWWLSEFAEYATRFFREHDGGQEDVAMWGRLVEYFPERG